MSDSFSQDSFGEARARAVNSLNNHWFDSFRLAIVAGVTVSITSGGVFVAMVAAKMLDTRQAWAAIAAISLVTAPVVYVCLEMRRMMERSEALSELLRAIRTYESLIGDARAERDRLHQQLMEAEAMKGGLLFALVASRGVERDDSGGE